MAWIPCGCCIWRLSLGPIVAKVVVVGCEPLDFGDEFEGRMGLSLPVQAAVEEACHMVEAGWRFACLAHAYTRSRSFTPWGGEAGMG